MSTMAKIHGFGSCSNCGVPCTPGNFLSHEKKRFCTACWVSKNNPDHPEISQIREKVDAAAEEWKCAKWSREDYHLPKGPKPHRN